MFAKQLRYANHCSLYGRAELSQAERTDAEELRHEPAKGVFRHHLQPTGTKCAPREFPSHLYRSVEVIRLSISR